MKLSVMKWENAINMKCPHCGRFLSWNITKGESYCCGSTFSIHPKIIVLKEESEVAPRAQFA